MLLSHSGLPYAIDFMAAERFFCLLLLFLLIVELVSIVCMLHTHTHNETKWMNMSASRSQEEKDWNVFWCFVCLCEFHVRHMTTCRITQPIKLSEELHLECSTLKPFCVYKMLKDKMFSLCVCIAKSLFHSVCVGGMCCIHSSSYFFPMSFISFYRLCFAVV